MERTISGKQSAGEALTAVTTVLMPVERVKVDAAGSGVYSTLHRESVAHARADLRERRANAVVISVARCGSADTNQVSAMVREFPRTPTVALMTAGDTHSAQVVLALGRSGIRTLVDVRDAEGWYQLRRIFVSTRAGDIGQIALRQLAVDLAGAPEDCSRFFDTIFQSPRPISTVRQLARELGVVPSTLMSRFFRAHLPAPKRYLAMARLVHAAQLFENPGLSIATVANRLDYSSPQSFGRHIRSLLHLSAVTFRERYDGEGMLHRFRDELVLPFQRQLRRLSPIEPRGIYMKGRTPRVEE